MGQLFEHYPNKTIVIYKDKQVVFTSEEKGVRPMMVYMDTYGPSEEPLTVIDRIVGRGAVILALLINAKTIKTPLISESAMELAEHHGLTVEAEKVVPYIINRQGDGRCPIESAVLGMTDVDEGYAAIKAAIAKLMAGSESSHGQG